MIGYVPARPSTVKVPLHVVVTVTPTAPGRVYVCSIGLVGEPGPMFS